MLRLQGRSPVATGWILVVVEAAHDNLAQLAHQEHGLVAQDLGHCDPMVLRWGRRIRSPNGRREGARGAGNGEVTLHKKIGDERGRTPIPGPWRQPQNSMNPNALGASKTSGQTVKSRQTVKSAGPFFQ